MKLFHLVMLSAAQHAREKGSLFKQQKPKQNPSHKGKAPDPIARIDSNVGLGSFAGRFRPDTFLGLHYTDC